MIQEIDNFKRNCDIVTAFQKFQYGRHWIYIVKGTPSKTFHYNIGYIYTKIILFDKNVSNNTNIQIILMLDLKFEKKSNMAVTGIQFLKNQFL